MRIILSSILLLISCSFALADITEKDFVSAKVKLVGCSFSADVINIALKTGLDRVAKVNQNLASRIRSDAFKKNLIIYCDVPEAPAAVHYDDGDDSIHLRTSSPGDSNTMANFFHEFLHFYGLDHIKDPRIVGDYDVFVYDPVYACHLTGFPDLADRLKIDTSFVTRAGLMCATVSPVFKDLRGIIY